MSLIERVGRVAVGVGTVLINSTRPAQASDGGPTVRKRQVYWPYTPDSATPDKRMADDYATLYGPTSFGMDGSAAIEDACPMTSDVHVGGTFLALGDTNTTLNLLFTDQALLNFTRLAQTASRELLLARKQPLPDWLGPELR